MSELGKLLIGLGVVLVVAGGVMMLLGRTNLPLGRLPGDIVYRGKHTTFYFPLATSVVVSVVLTIVMYVVGRLKRWHKTASHEGHEISRRLCFQAFLRANRSFRRDRPQIDPPRIWLRHLQPLDSWRRLFVLWSVMSFGTRVFAARRRQGSGWESRAAAQL
jgi:Protein of unknown function (DUF2905)